MRRQLFFVAVLAFAFASQAVPVSSTDAGTAARAWVGSGTTLGVRLGTSVDSVKTYSAPGGAKFHAVRLADGGTVFMTADSEDEPVIGFSSAESLDLSEGSRLRQLLDRDVTLREATRGAASASSSAGRRSVATSARTPVGKWAKLIAAGQAVAVRSAEATSSAAPVKLVDDLRVAPLIKTQWDQSESRDDLPCFNFYTPAGAQDEHLPCGCTATAAAQIMKYFQWPQTEMASAVFECSVNGTKKKLATMGGLYDWASMALDTEDDPADDETKCEAIGHLTYDIAVSLGTDWSDASGGSASPRELGRVYRDSFGYANGYSFLVPDRFNTGAGGLHNLSIREKIIYANLDAGRPVQLGIYGYPKGHIGEDSYWAGHSVVGDGYGYRQIDGVPTAFVHINLGWGGKDDMWYNIPEINTSETGAHVGESGFDFLYMGGAMFNIFTDEAGLDILAGRITDYSGTPVEGAKVTVLDADAVEVASVNSGAHGIYTFALPGGSNYTVRASSADGLLVASPKAVWLPKTVGDSNNLVVVESGIGNLWGVDLTIANPSVRVGERIFSTLDDALDHVMRMLPSPAVVEVLRPTTLESTVELGVDCLIVATNENPAASAIVRAAGARLEVAPGATLALSNLAFAAASDLVVSVQTNGVLSLSSGVDFGVPPTQTAVRTQDTNAVLVAGALTHGFALDCTRSPLSGRFGTAVCDAGTAAASAVRIANANVSDGTIRGAVVGTDGALALEWADVPVPVEDAVGYFVVDGETNALARLDALLKRYEEVVASGGDVDEIVIRDVADLTLSRPLTVTSDLAIRGEGAVAITNIAGTAGFAVLGASLTVDGITFDGYRGNALFEVGAFDGASGELTLGSGVAFVDVIGTNYHSGAVAVHNGRVTVNGAVFSGCRASGESGTTARNSNGGAIYVGNGAELVLNGGRITDCSARSNGGGIYAYSKAKVFIGGDLVVRGNTAGTSPSPVTDSDIYLYNNKATLTLAGWLKGGIASVGVRYSGGSGIVGNAEGEPFVTVDQEYFDEQPESALLDSLEAFYCDADSELTATNGATTFAWTRLPQDYRTDDESLAVVDVAGAGSEIDGWYRSVKRAFDALTNATSAATVTLLKNADFANEIEVPGTVTLLSAGETACSLTNVSDAARIHVTGSLTLTNVVLNGGTGQAGLIRVEGGSLTLQSGTTIERVLGLADRASGAVSVWDGGVFRMESGAEIRSCTNLFWNGGTQGGYCGGLLLDASTATLAGGTISDCWAGTAGGAFFGNGSKVLLSGDVTIANNWNLYGWPDDVRVADLSELHLADVLTGAIGYTEGAINAQSDPNVFGVVDATFSGDDAALADSARRFRHDVTGDCGQAVARGSARLLVWSDAIENGQYVDPEGKVYDFIDAGTPIRIAIPEAVVGLVYESDVARIGVLEGVGYALEGNSATNAGDYVATASLRDGFIWEDGTDSPKEIAWTIAKATCDMSGITFPDAVKKYDGASHSLEIVGTLPEGVTVAYYGNDRTDRGVYTVIARFSPPDEDNYEPIEDMSATLMIGDEAVNPDPGPGPDPEVVQPDPIAFQSITQLSVTEWEIVVTNRKAWCNYRLLWTADLASGFTATGAWEQATVDGAWVTNVNIDAEGPAIFWKAEAKEGEKKE